MSRARSNPRHLVAMLGLAACALTGCFHSASKRASVG